MSGDDLKAQYLGYVAEAVKTLGVKAGDERAEHVAALRMARSAITARLIAGREREGDAMALLKLDEALKQVLPPPEPMKVAIEFVEGVRGIYKCRFCGRQNELKPGEYTPVKSKPEDKLPRTIDLVAEKPADATAAQSERGTMIPPAPKPEPKLFEPAHDFHAGAPLRNGNEPWRNR
jgi:hypothetical protein